MRQRYKPIHEEWVRLHNLPYFMEDGKKIHFDENNWYELDGSNFSVIQRSPNDIQ